MVETPPAPTVVVKLRITGFGMPLGHPCETVSPVMPPQLCLNLPGYGGDERTGRLLRQVFTLVRLLACQSGVGAALSW